MSEPDVVRKFQLEAQLIAAARAFVDFVREHEIADPAMAIPMDQHGKEILALGSRENIIRLLSGR